MEAIQAIETHYFEQAYRSGISMTQRFLVARGAPGDQAEEIAQAAWAKGWQCREQLRDPEMVLPWINTIARNMFAGEFRTERRRGELEEFRHPYHMNLDSIAARQVLDRCRDKDRDLLVEHYLAGRSAEEIAREQGLASASVRVRLLRIRSALRRALDLMEE
jgi:RNA polymerase sigma factor (sigma-70 family)